jgi:hypothetical protein
MAGTEKVSDQIKGIQNAFEISTHTFLNKLVQGLAEKVQQANPDLVVIPTGKKMKKDEISLALRGEVFCDDADEAEDTKIKVENTINSIKTTSDIEMLIKDK